jgi:glycosyltransferase involved in cell wall biosynthesis
MVDATRSGMVFRAGDPKDFAEKVNSLYSNPTLQKECGENGKKASLEGALNWETTQKILVDLYRAL